MRWIQQFLGRLLAVVKGKPRWGQLFAMALSMVLFFQACGSDTATVTAPDNQPASESAGELGKANTMENLVNEHKGDAPNPTPVALAEPAVPVVGEDMVYATVEGQSVKGYLARPKSASAEAALPAIIAIHEWWGLNDNIKATARRLAGEGYTVLALDLYGGEVADEPTQAKDLMRTVVDNPGPAQDNITQAAQLLTDRYRAPKIGSIGWCFGGNWSLRTGLLLPNLEAMAIYYGQLILAPEALDGLDMPIIGFFGEDDSSIPVQDVENFKKTLDNLGKTVSINLYPGVGHAFANPSGNNYNPAAAEDAWKKTTAFFAKYLQAS